MTEEERFQDGIFPFYNHTHPHPQEGQGSSIQSSTSGEASGVEPSFFTAPTYFTPGSSCVSSGGGRLKNKIEGGQPPHHPQHSRHYFNHHPMPTATATSTSEQPQSSQTDSNLGRTNEGLSNSSGRSSPTGSSSRQFREVVGMLIICYLEHGATVRSEEFKNIVEHFLCPIFEPTFNPRPSQSGKCHCDNHAEGLEEHMPSSSTPSNWDSLSCAVCYGVLVEPVTIPCGHSYCRKCLQKEVIGQSCRRCSHILSGDDVSQCKTNVLVGALSEKWWAEEVRASNLRTEGNSLFELRMFQPALEKYSEALNLTPCDHVSLSNRSHALLTAGNSESALKDAEAATRLCPAWPKGYFRKSAALISLGRYEDAFLSLTICMYLMKFHSSTQPQGPSSKSTLNSVPLQPKTTSKTDEEAARAQVVKEMIKILQKLFLQTTSLAASATLRRHSSSLRQREFTPYPNRHNHRLGGRHSKSRRHHRSSESCSEYNSCSSGSGSSGDEGEIQEGKTSLVEHLTMKMCRLLSRASQDLKSFEVRLKVFHLKSTLRRVTPSVLSSNDVECSLCYRLLYQPVSTVCGHTFCRSCLDRCLDHNPACPLCKTSLQHYLSAPRGPAPVTEFVDKAIQQYFPKELKERLAQHLHELNSTVLKEEENATEGENSTLDIPIFVCTMAFPTVPCPLHVFEPRYRLMIRRCMENGTNRFGMSCYQTNMENNYGEIGTLLEIKNIQYFNDGRSVLETVGVRRFRTIRKTVVDGYNAATVELLSDKPVTLPEEITATKELHDKVFTEATAWFQSIGQVRRQRIQSHFGPMPGPEENWMSLSDGPSWTWWLLAILPLDSKAQLSILSMCSLQKRLECILKVLTFVKNGIAE